MKKYKIKINKGQSGKTEVTVPYNPTYIKKLKGIKGHRWDPEQKCWTFPNSDDVIKKLFDIFKGKDLRVDPSLRQGKEDNVFEDLRKEMVSRKYSPKTIKAYIHYNKDLVKFIGKDSGSIVEKDIKDYLFYLAEEKKVATSTLNSAINVLKFYYGTVLKRRFTYDIKRPRKDKKLPVVLSKEEVTRILSAVDNIKHKAILMLVYSAGLRVSEVVKLKPKDIDSERKLVLINGAKGRKDRCTILSEVALQTLRKYWDKYRPKVWLFEGEKEVKHITIRSV